MELPIGVFAGFLIFITQIIYLKDTTRRKIKPSVLCWFGWGLLMGTSVCSQIIQEGWDWSQIGIIVSSLGCLIIALTSFFIGNYQLEKKDWLFILVGFICLFVYLISKDALLTTVFAICADLLVGIPTLTKAYQNPESEKTIAWKLSLSTWSLSLIISFNHGMIYSIFPIYLFLYCLYMVYLLYWRKTTMA